MGNHDHRPVHHQLLHGLLQQVLTFSVQRTGRLVKQQYRRIFQYGPGDGDALLLAARQAGAFFAQNSLVTLGQLTDELVGMGRHCRIDDLLICSPRIAEADIFQDAAGE